MTNTTDKTDAKRIQTGAPARRPGQPGSTTEQSATARPDDHVPVNAPGSTAPGEHQPAADRSRR